MKYSTFLCLPEILLNRVTFAQSGFGTFQGSQGPQKRLFHCKLNFWRASGSSRGKAASDHCNEAARGYRYAYPRVPCPTLYRTMRIRGRLIFVLKSFYPVPGRTQKGVLAASASCGTDATAVLVRQTGSVFPSRTSNDAGATTF
eukprot:1353515-Rhodomonas_salina.1